MSTIPMHFIRACLSGAEEKNVDTDNMLSKAGISREDYNRSGQWVRPEQYVALVQAVTLELNDEFFGLTKQRCKPGHFAIATKMASQLPSLGMVYQEWTNLYNVVRDDISMTLESANGITTLSFELSNPELDQMHFLSEFTLITLHRFACWLTNKHIQLHQISLPYAKPAHHFYYSKLFPGEIIYQAESTSLSFNTDYLNYAPVRSAKELSLALKTAPAAFIKLPDDHSYVNRTNRILLNYYRQSKRIPCTKETAEQLCLSQRTLRRKLQKEGSTYQELKDQLRRDIAIEKLRKENTSIEDIAEQLSFSDPGTFSRAFKRWTQLSPVKFREQALALSINEKIEQSMVSIFY